MALSPEIVQAMVRILEVKDLSTAAHTWRVVLYTRALAEEAGVNHDVIERLTVGAALHDVGKIEVPDAILQKPGPLNTDEFEVIKTHAALGHAQLVRMGEDDPLVLELVRHHHERMDGQGYPDGITGEKIPMAARYFSVVDTFDALTSLRPYRHDVGEGAAERAIAELKAGVGTRYCKEAVDAFEGLFRRRHLDWVQHYFNDQAVVPAYDELHQSKQVAERSRSSKR